MASLRELLDRYLTIYHADDEAGFRAMVADGCIRHDPGSTVALSIEDNVARFREFQRAFPGFRFTATYVWEHGDDAITVCFTMRAGDTVLSAVEVFRFADERIVEVWNTAAAPGAW